MLIAHVRRPRFRALMKVNDRSFLGYIMQVSAGLQVDRPLAARLC